ncbi:hypothetical protein BU24DRAFT_360215 [Aaosphaeria arxii CBS 175.79]|uniref:Uncharacterized protein n=1 Tax=Aaosphaeria arxii CBS 175.79 TaxID=1450172 RepID=A0A6A5X6F1_9PLEO|nr:uncharacterized protein BU24DRAFT_360215 [Aaosphaeria arxii CBS 175.79]KAF2008480.1 hypothetical protein BU24DRAFT_360215 [Aaosphaeria arxii CBS 175.79]
MDDEIMALRLQLDEVNSFENPTSLKGKYRQNSPPDDVVAFEGFQAEVLAHINFMRDLRLAHSIANAVDADAQLIAELTALDVQIQEDRRFAIRLDKEERGTADGSEDIDWTQSETPFNASHCLIGLDDDEEEPEAGPSMTYAQRQAQALGKLSEEHRCVACFGDFCGTTTIKLSCGDR